MTPAELDELTRGAFGAWSLDPRGERARLIGESWVRFFRHLNRDLFRSVLREAMHRHATRMPTVGQLRAILGEFEGRRRESERLAPAEEPPLTNIERGEWIEKLRDEAARRRERSPGRDDVITLYLCAVATRLAENIDRTNAGQPPRGMGDLIGGAVRLARSLGRSAGNAAVPSARHSADSRQDSL